jgi:hypothetical protein
VAISGFDWGDASNIAFSSPGRFQARFRGIARGLLCFALLATLLRMAEDALPTTMCEPGRSEAARQERSGVSDFAALGAALVGFVAHGRLARMGLDR